MIQTLRISKGIYLKSSWIIDVHMGNITSGQVNNTVFITSKRQREKQPMVSLYSYIQQNICKCLHTHVGPFAWLIVHPAHMLKAIELFVSSHKNKRYLSTLPRSGTGYIIRLLATASDIEDGGLGKYEFVNNRWVGNFNIVCPAEFHNLVAILKRNEMIHKNFFVVAHHPIQKTNILNVNSTKVVFTVRSIPQQLESWLMHTFGDRASQDEFIRQGYVERTIDYFNYWGKFISKLNRRAEKDYICIRYEDMVADPLSNLLRIVNFWNLEIGESALESAVGLCSKEKMMSKIPEDQIATNKRLTIRQGRGRLFSEENASYINSVINDKLKYNFGYEY